MMHPTVHINGTPIRHLIEQFSAAHTAVEAAIDQLSQAAPHGRDYYPQGDHAYLQARTEHETRLKLLQSIALDLSKLTLELLDKEAR